MTNTVDYYFSVASPWAYLGSARFIEITRRYGAAVTVMPVELSRIFAASGGSAFSERAPQRQQYRQLELARWSHWLRIPLTLEPRFYPVDRRPASYLLIAAREAGLPVLDLSHRVLRAIWHEEKNIADWDTLRKLVLDAGLDGEALVNAAQSPAVARQFQRDTDLAIAAQVFGAPAYVVDGELFWGQDRLEFVEEKLATPSLQNFNSAFRARGL
jgi:2-hydroxychromene-2-carboxylate isomerase